MPVLAALWHILQGNIGALIAAADFGQLFGASFFGWVADRIGRLPTLAISVALYAVAGISAMAR